jgi:hypothetical protein
MNEEFEREMNYKSPSQIQGDLVAREFADGQEEKEEIKIAKHITVLDFEISRVFQYALWYVPSDADDNTYERFMSDDKGHNLTNCQWMVHENPQIITN